MTTCEFYYCYNREVLDSQRAPCYDAALGDGALEKENKMIEETETTSETPKAAKKPQETLTKYQDKYKGTGHCGDEIATAFASYVKVGGKVSEEKLYEVAKANSVDMSKYEGKNIGMKRMNLGNRLRGLHKKGETVTIGDMVIAGAAK
jgi:hypothetical protein